MIGRLLLLRASYAGKISDVGGTEIGGSGCAAPIGAAASGQILSAIGHECRIDRRAISGSLISVHAVHGVTSVVGTLCGAIREGIAKRTGRDFTRA